MFSMVPVSFSFGTSPPDVWGSYLDGSVDAKPYYLYELIMASPRIGAHSQRALDLGAGAGNVVVDLASRGWEVTALDNSPRAQELTEERVRFFNGRLHFQRASFEQAHLTGYYDLVLSFFALPFGKKETLPSLLTKLNQHMRPSALFAATFFGPEHTFVLNGQAYALDEVELKELLSTHGFVIRYLIRRQFTQKNDHWDVFDVIAIKN